MCGSIAPTCAAARGNARRAGPGPRRARQTAGIGAVQQLFADRDPAVEQRGDHRRSAAWICCARGSPAPSSFAGGRARDTDSYRVIFSEADLLPGLIVDKYNDVLAMQALTQAFDREDLRQVVLDSLAEHFPDASVLERVDAHIRELEQLPARDSQLLRGERSSTIFTLNGVRFHFDGLSGQKTGAFLDQRENYAAAARYAHGEALDCLHLSGRICAASGAGLRQRDGGRFLAARAGSRRAERAAQSRPASLRRDRVDRRPTPSIC